MEENHKITIGFSLEDEFGDKFSATSETTIFESVENDLMGIGRQLNAFLAQCGYIREGSLVFMESLSEEEYNAIEDFLSDYRKDNKKEVYG